MLIGVSLLLLKYLISHNSMVSQCVRSFTDRSEEKVIDVMISPQTEKLQVRLIEIINIGLNCKPRCAFLKGSNGMKMGLLCPCMGYLYCQSLHGEESRYHQAATPFPM